MSAQPRAAGKAGRRTAAARVATAAATAALAVLAAFPLGASATPIINTYTGVTQGGWAFGGTMAVQFTPVQNMYLTDVQLFVNSGGEGAASALDIHLMTDAMNVPGTVIETLGTLPRQSSFTPKLEMILSRTNPLLTGGTPYWIAASFHPIPESGSAAGWVGSGNPYVPVAASMTRDLKGPWSVQPNNPQFIVNGSLPQPSCVLDLDGNGTVDALTDGLMMLRAMFGLTGNAATVNAIGSNSPRLTWTAIQPVIFLSKMDIDGNGSVDALTDGMLLLRTMFGLKGPAVVVANALGANPTRSTWADVRTYINTTCGTAFPE